MTTNEYKREYLFYIKLVEIHTIRNIKKIKIF